MTALNVKRKANMQFYLHTSQFYICHVSLPLKTDVQLNIIFQTGGHARTARALLTILIPGQLIFVFTMTSIKVDQTVAPVPSIFVLFYLVAAVIQVIYTEINGDRYFKTTESFIYKKKLDLKVFNDRKSQSTSW